MALISDGVRELANSRVVICRESDGVNQMAIAGYYMYQVIQVQGPWPAEFVLTWSNVLQVSLDISNQFPDMLWRSCIKGNVVSRVNIFCLVLVVSSPFLGVQFAQDLINVPSREIRAENRDFIICISRRPMSFVSTL